VGGGGGLSNIGKHDREREVVSAPRVYAATGGDPIPVPCPTAIGEREREREDAIKNGSRHMSTISRSPPSHD
jgi:hypothetical protein